MASRVRAVVKPKPVAASAPLRIATYSSTTWAATSSGTVGSYWRTWGG